MESLVDPAFLVNAVIVFGPRNPSGAFSPPTAVRLARHHNLVGAHMHEHRLGGMLAGRLKQVERAAGVDIEILKRNVTCFVVRGLGSAMYDNLRRACHGWR